MISSAVIVSVRKFIGHRGGGSRSVDHGYSGRNTVCDANSPMLGKDGKKTEDRPVCHKEGNTGCGSRGENVIRLEEN